MGYNEVDDQFALAYCALKKDKINLIAAYAAPFLNHRSTGAGDGMEKSYNEIGKVLNKTDSTIPYYRGSNNFLKDESIIYFFFSYLISFMFYNKHTILEYAIIIQYIFILFNPHSRGCSVFIFYRSLRIRTGR